MRIRLSEDSADMGKKKKSGSSGWPAKSRRRSPPGVSLGVRIDHSAIIDGFAQMVDRTHWESKEVRCDKCRRFFFMSAHAQKYVHEVRKVPIKHQAYYCADCLPRAVERNRQKRRLAEYNAALEAAALAVKSDATDTAAMVHYIRLRLDNPRSGEKDPPTRLLSQLWQRLRHALKHNPTAEGQALEGILRARLDAMEGAPSAGCEDMCEENSDNNS